MCPYARHKEDRLGTLLVAPQKLHLTGPVIYLAGPIQGCRDWRHDAILQIRQLNKTVHIASPRRIRILGGRMSHEEYMAQDSWEALYMERARINGALLFWMERESAPVPGRDYAQEARFSLGKWSERAPLRLAVGMHEAFSGSRYLSFQLGSRAQAIQVHHTLEETCRAAVLLVNHKR